MCFCCGVFEMDELFELAEEVQEYLRLEAERQRLVKEIIELEIEASRTYHKE